MKKFKRFLAVLLILAAGVCFLNAKTDIFLNFGAYVPFVSERYPEVSEKISFLSERVATVTDRIPTISEVTAMIKHEELPIDPSDVAVNAYIANSPMLTFYPRENIAMITDYSEIQLFGVTESRRKAHLVAEFSDENDNKISQITINTSSNGEFNKIISIPDTDEPQLKLAVYAGSKEYGQFESWVYNYITLTRMPDGSWEILNSPVYENNKSLYEKDKSVSGALKYTASIQSNSKSIISIAQQLTQGLDNDYDKALALHDWICGYMYYDVDSLNAKETPPYYATDVVKSGKAVCLGFATLMASLCRAVNIPCNVVSGYALGVGADTEWTDETVETDEQNHAWNEVYADGRWIIVDTTWDCANKIREGQREKGDEISHIYFDANLRFFSNNHKIIEYSKRR